MSPDRSNKGLWGRVKEVLGVSDEDEDLASAPQVTSTFTAHRFPSGKGPLSGPLFPADRDQAGKWELYEDGWKQTEVTPGHEPRPDPSRDGWAPVDHAPEEPPADPPPTARSDAAPADVPPSDVRPEDEPPATPAEPPAAAAPAVPSESAPATRPPDVHTPRDLTAGATEQRDRADEAFQPPRPVPAAEQRHHDDHPPEGPQAATPGTHASQGPEELSATLEAWAAGGDPAGLLAHVDDDEADALARAFGFDELPRRGPAARNESPTDRTPPPEAPAPAPPVDEDQPSEPVAPLSGAQPTWEPEPDEVVRPPAPVTRDTGAERQVEVHEERVAQAQGRARRAPRPGVNVHDAHLDHHTGPVTLTPSEAMALAERGRGAIGPRTDVGPAS